MDESYMPTCFSWSHLSAHSFLLTGTPHRQGEIADTNTRPPTNDGIFPKPGNLLWAKLHSTGRIDCKTPQRSSNPAGQPQLACRIKKKHDSLANPIALAHRPQPYPLRDRQISASSCAADGIFHVERDVERRHGLPGMSRSTL